MIAIYTYRYIFLLYKDIHNALKRKKTDSKTVYVSRYIAFYNVCVRACMYTH